MKNWVSCAAALVFGMLAAPLATATAAGDGTNWMRDYVQKRQQAVMQRFLGNRIGVAPQIIVEPKIIGGRVAPPHRWPFQVALLFADNPDNAAAQYCGGSLIGPQHVLTAAHCVDFLSGPAQIRVLTGTQSLASGGTRQRVRRIKIHPKWDTRTSDFDIAVLTLRTAVTGITPVKLIAKVQEDTLSEPGTRAYVTGWGDTQLGSGTSFPDALHEVRVPIISRAICNRPVSYDGQVTNRMLCAGFPAGGRDSCQGDSGGPLIVPTLNGRYRIQAGVVSWGIGCALPDLFGVYARVAVLRPWITAVMANESALAEAKRCTALEGSAQAGCLDEAIAAAEAEARNYLARIKQGANRTLDRAAETAQRAWAASLADVCAFETALDGQIGRKSCVLQHTLERTATLAAHLSELDE